MNDVARKSKGSRQRSKLEKQHWQGKKEKRKRKRGTGRLAGRCNLYSFSLCSHLSTSFAACSHPSLFLLYRPYIKKEKDVFLIPFCLGCRKREKKEQEKTKYNNSALPQSQPMQKNSRSTINTLFSFWLSSALYY